MVGAFHGCSICWQVLGCMILDTICLFRRFVFGLDLGREKSICTEILKVATV